jgi:hypothetical protein
MKSLIVVLACCIALAGCSGLNDTQQRALTGTAIGASGGAILGAIGGNASRTRRWPDLRLSEEERAVRLATRL